MDSIDDIRFTFLRKLGILRWYKRERDIHAKLCTTNYDQRMPSQKIYSPKEIEMAISVVTLTDVKLSLLVDNLKGIMKKFHSNLVTMKEYNEALADIAEIESLIDKPKKK